MGAEHGIEELRSHSTILGQIASLVEDDCDEETTTLEGVARVCAERDFYRAALALVSVHGIERAGWIFQQTGKQLGL